MIRILTGRRTPRVRLRRPKGVTRRYDNPADCSHSSTRVARRTAAETILTCDWCPATWLAVRR